ncbi:AraC family transcriptional regulator [uncultured Eubacterium sp.]|uniref:helix-turn-helix domain-containing protein n=1 Tax=uncultured Eubacterium sp. TaxID=165185 RepID=UPI0025DD3598|nr:AraC family transcriptional regulator [uncultured Eubacterium sp.]MCI6536515.1 AraC family transcriptional regulator [Lachnospiraceae bacterium]
MKKAKGKMELRYYDIPQNEFLIALQNQNWQNKYQTEEDGLHFHNLLEIGLCMQGYGTMRLEEETVHFETGMISIIPANFPHSTMPEGPDGNTWAYLFVDPEKILASVYPDDILMQQKMLENINRKAYIGKKESVPNLNRIVSAVFYEMQQKPDFYRETVKGLSLSLMMMIARLNNKLDPATEGVRQKNGFDQIRPALEHIRDNFANPTKIAEIASVCHMSESHFRRLFEENMGMTPVDYLNQVRIKKACDMIRKTGYSMEEIAVKVGFSTTSTFNRNFKRIVGTSPYHWKKSPENFETRLADFNILVEKGW